MLYSQLKDQQVALPTQSVFWRQKGFYLVGAPFIQTRQIFSMYILMKRDMSARLFLFCQIREFKGNSKFFSSCIAPPSTEGFIRGRIWDLPMGPDVPVVILA